MNLSLFQKIDCMAWSRDDCDVIMQIRLLIFSGYEVEWVNIQWQKVWLSYVGQFLRSGSANIAQFSKVKILPQIITSYYILLYIIYQSLNRKGCETAPLSGHFVFLTWIIFFKYHSSCPFLYPHKVLLNSNNCLYNSDF